MSLTALTFVLAFFAGCVMALARHPIFGLVTYVLVFYVHPQSRWWGQGWIVGVRWSLIAAVATLLALAVHRRGVRATKSFSSQKPVILLGLLIAWMAIQSFWAIDKEAHSLLVTYYLKFLLAMYMVYECIDSENNLRAFLWAHVLGCFYFGLIAFTTHDGGRFDTFGGPGIGDSNGGALALATGALIGAALFLAGQLRARIALLAVLPILVNGLVATISRSGFLALMVGGLTFNFSTPRPFRSKVWLVSALGVFLFALLANSVYWERITTIKFGGAAIEGVDTGSDRLETIRAQWRMFEGHPAGCGHMCTAALSPSYLDARFLSEGARASHNTFMSMLVDHSLPGALAYLLMVAWTIRCIWILERRYRWSSGLVPFAVPAIGGSLIAFIAADLFVPTVRYEIRFWFFSIVMLLLQWKPERVEVTEPGTAGRSN